MTCNANIWSRVELLSSSARVTSVKFQQGGSVWDTWTHRTDQGYLGPSKSDCFLTWSCTMHILAKSARDSWTTFCVHNMVINRLSLIWSCSVWESFQQFGADLPTTILAILNSCQSFGTVPMQRLASEIGKLRQFAQLFSAIPTLLVAIRHHATLPLAIFRNRQNGRAPPHCDALQLSENLFHLSVGVFDISISHIDFRYIDTFWIYRYRYRYR